MQRVHDYPFLIRRWRAVARRAGCRLREFAEFDGAPLFYLRGRTLTETGGAYISAGIHGDEPAGGEALIRWAEANAGRLADLPLLLFPCLNPWGLANNCRFDAHGADLNRLFHATDNAMVTGVKGLITRHRFTLAMTLHEDYDGEGLYLYEIDRHKRFWGESLLKMVRGIMPIEGRARIEGRQAVAGIIRRRLTPRLFAKIGYPEAAWLYLHHADHAITLETPSEFALEDRVRAHLVLLDECVRRATMIANKEQRHVVRNAS
jgi:protein MpaA